MQFKPVTGIAFRATCCVCGRGVLAGSEPRQFPGAAPRQPDKVWADLDGEPYVAYYCEVCYNAVELQFCRLAGRPITGQVGDSQ
jgi:hypothetical protein